MEQERQEQEERERRYREREQQIEEHRCAPCSTPTLGRGPTAASPKGLPAPFIPGGNNRL